MASVRRCASWPGRRLADLERAEHAHVEVAAAHHRERVGVMEVGRPRRFGDRDLARVDQIEVDVSAGRRAAHAEHAVLGVQHHACLRCKVIGDQGGLADSQVDVRPAGCRAR
jgi:hypothetical protein